MLRIFSKYNAWQFLFVGLLLLIVRIIVKNCGLPVLNMEIEADLVGQKLAIGGHLYKDIFTSLEPLSALVYYLITLFAANLQPFLFWASLLIVFAQAILFSSMLNENKIFGNPTIIPAILYALFSVWYIDYFTLSPQIMGMTFVLLAFSRMLQQARSLKGESDFFYIGLWLGLASMFYFPYFILLPFAFISLGLFTSTSIKKYFILLVAFFLPYIILFVYYFWTNNVEQFFRCALKPMLTIDVELETPLMTILKFLILPFIFLTFAGYSILINGKYIHFQYKIIKMGGHWVVFSLLSLLFVPTLQPHSFFVLIPSLALLISFMFSSKSKPTILLEGLFLTLIIGILMILYFGLNRKVDIEKEKYFVEQPIENKNYAIEGKEILVLGEGKSYYYKNNISGPYLEWDLSKVYFEDLNRYDNITAIYEQFDKFQPEYIVDLEGLVPSLAEKIPRIKAEYKLLEGSKIYRRNY